MTTNSSAPTVSVVIPVYNNAATLRELVQRITSTIEATGREFEIVLVNDGSADASWSVLVECAERDQRVLAVAHSRNFGQHPAIRAALERATGDITVLMDADLQDIPEEMPRLLAGLDDPDVDIVYTTWTMTDGSRGRLTSRVFHRLFSWVSEHQVPQNIGTYRAFRRPVREALLAYPERGVVYGPLMAQMGFSSAYVGVDRQPPPGRSSYSWRRRLQLAGASLIGYGSAIFKVTMLMGFSLAALSSLYLVVLVLQYAIGGRPLPNGLSLLIAITVLLSGVMLFAMGVIIAYLMAVFREVLGRPVSHVSRHVGRGLAPVEPRS